VDGRTGLDIANVRVLKTMQEGTDTCQSGDSGDDVVVVLIVLLLLMMMMLGNGVASSD